MNNINLNLSTISPQLLFLIKPRDFDSNPPVSSVHYLKIKIPMCCPKFRYALLPFFFLCPLLQNTMNLMKRMVGKQLKKMAKKWWQV